LSQTVSVNVPPVRSWWPHTPSLHLTAPATAAAPSAAAAWPAWHFVWSTAVSQVWHPAKATSTETGAVTLRKVQNPGWRLKLQSYTKRPGSCHGDGISRVSNGATNKSILVDNITILNVAAASNCPDMLVRYNSAATDSQSA